MSVILNLTEFHFLQNDWTKGIWDVYASKGLEEEPTVIIFRLDVTSTLKVEADGSSERLINSSNIIWRINPECQTSNEQKN